MRNKFKKLLKIKLSNKLIKIKFFLIFNKIKFKIIFKIQSRVFLCKNNKKFIQ